MADALVRSKEKKGFSKKDDGGAGKLDDDDVEEEKGEEEEEEEEEEPRPAKRARSRGGKKAKMEDEEDEDEEEDSSSIFRGSVNIPSRLKKNGDLGTYLSHTLHIRTPTPHSLHTLEQQPSHHTTT